MDIENTVLHGENTGKTALHGFLLSPKTRPGEKIPGLFTYQSLLTEDFEPSVQN